MLSEVPIGTICALVENMGDDEVRHTFYERTQGPVLYDRNVRVFHLATIQGVPGEPARYERRGFRHSSEAHAKLPVVIMDMPREATNRSV